MKFKHISSLLFFNLFFGLILATNLGVFNYDIEKPISSAANSVATLALTGDISVDDQEACLNQTPGPSITFTGSDSDDNFPYTFEYTINDGDVNTISTTDSSPSVSIAAPTSEVGEFTYTLIRITDTNEEEAELDSEITITINPLPEVSFEIVSGDGACSGTPVVFSATIIGDGPFSYAWDFGDGATSTNPNPSHIYEALGCGTSVFDVTLTVTDDNECDSSFSAPVDVLDKPDLDFFDANSGFPPFDNACEGGNFEISVGNSSQSISCIDNYDIDWGDGNEDLSLTNVSFPINYIYTSTGVFEVVITATNSQGCINTKAFEVNNSTNESITITSPQGTVNLCEPSDELVWLIGDWHNDPNDALYTIDFDDGTTVEISNSEMVASDYYDPPQDFPVFHVYEETNCPGEPFFVSITLATACLPATEIQGIGPITLISTPEVSFDSPEIECINTEVIFENTSSNGFSQNCSLSAQWTWNYGDGTIQNIVADTPPNGAHTYTTPGTYIVTLFPTNNIWNNCPPVPFSREICIEAPLEPLFSLSETEDCGPLTVIPNNTTDESTSCEEVDYLWNVTYTPGYCGDTDIHSFINDTDATSADPEILFTGPGIYTLTLSATNTCGTVVSPPQIINVKAPPTITLDPIDDVCAPAEITPTYDFDICEATTQEFNWIIAGGTSPTDWEFIDGSNASSPNPTINFITPNTYTITVELTNECGTESSSQEFTLQPVPEITNTDLIQTICSGVQVDEIVFESTEPGTTFSWITTATANIDGEVPSGGPGVSIPAHVLTLNPEINSGSVTYSVTPSLGDCEGATVDFIINVVPRPSITTQPVGDAVCIGGTTPPLFVVYINGTGAANYQWYSNTTPTNVGGTAIDPPEGTQATYTPPTDTPGTIYYYVVISFSVDSGCSDITSEVAAITVVPPIDPTEENDLQNICEGGESGVLSVTDVTGAGSISYQWYSNTTNTNTGGTPISGANSDTYTPPGPFDTVGIFYYYVVISDDAAGCFDIPSGVYTINVVADPTVTIDPIGPLEYCQDAIADPLTAIPNGGVGDVYTYEWYRVGSPDVLVGTDQTYTPLTGDVGVFSYYVVITQTASGCSNVSIPVEVTITLGPSITTQPVGDAVCIDGVTPPLTVAYQDGTGTPTYEWFRVENPDDVSVGTDPTFEPPTDQAGVFSYYVVISFPGNGGCSDITSNTVDITVVAPIETTNTPSVQDICVGGESEELIVTNTTGAGNVTYEWFSNTANTNTGGTPISGANSDTYTPPGPFDTVGIFYYYVVISDDAAGCFDIPSGVYTINVVADPTVTIDPIGPLEYCQDAIADPLTAIPNGGVGDVYTYEWYRVGSPDVLVGTDQTYTPLTGDVGVFSYYVVITQTASGCSNVSIPVEVTITLGPSITTQPVGDAVCIDGVTPPLTVAYQDGTGTPTYEWFRVENPDDVSVGTDPTFEPPTDQAGVFSYYVVISFPGNGGCSDITSNTVDITVVAPIETTNTPSVQDICVGGESEELIVTNTTGAGNVTYEWFSNTANTNTGGTPISGANSDTYTPPGPFDTVGIFYYYVVISDDAAGCFDIPSGVYTINVVADPTVTIDPIGPLEYCQDAIADPLTAIPNGGVGDVYTYEWYRVGSPDVLVGTDQTYTPLTGDVGVFSYYVVITQTASGCSNVSIPVEVTITLGPSITTQPVGDAVCIDGVTPPLTVAYQDGTGTPTYEWFRVENPDDVSVGTDPTFEPPTDQAGVFSYYVVISFPGNGGCSDITSNTVDITVVAPIETTNTPSVQDICVGGESEELIVTNTTGAGNVTYEWFSNTANTNTGGTPISGANSDTYTPPGPFDTVGIFYYYVVISDDAAGCFDIPSGVYTINVVADPTVTIDPIGPLEYCQDAIADPLTAIPNGGVGDVYTYEWYRVGSPDVLVGTDQTYTPLTGDVGVFSYYVVITQTASGCSNVSIPVEVTITLGPSITTQPVGDAVCIDGVTPPLTVAYQDGTGTPTYEWFRVENPDDVSVGTDPTFEPPTDQAGVFSYYVVISFPGNGGCSDITSNTVDITVVAPIETTNTPSVQDICVGGESEELIVTNTTGAGNVTYEWFSNTANTNTGGTPISGANSDTYTPPGPFDTVGIFYYYVVISDDAAGCFDIPSGVYTINVVADPTVTIDPIGPLEYCQDAIADPLTAIPNGGVGDVYTYEWYRVGSPDVLVGTDQTYTPLTGDVGVFSYYVVITQTASGCSNVSIPVEVTITLGPSITTQPVGDAVCIDGVTPPLTVAYQDGTGTPTYEWFRVENPDDVSVGTDPTFEPPTDQAGVFSYYVVISFPGNGGCSDITSNTVDITVVAPIETTNTPSVQDICVGGESEELIVTNTTGAGNVTYEWFSNTANTNTGGTPISGANSDTYTPPGPFDTVGIFYYYVVISDDAAGCFDIPSGVYTINVVADPTVTIDPIGPLEYCQDAIADPLTAIPNGGVGDVYTYEWYRVGSPDVLVGTDQTYTPLTGDVGVFSYYVVITQTASGCSNVSIPVEVTITLGPSITTQPVGDAVCIDGVTPPLTVAYQDGTGTPTYEWFRVENPDDVSVGTDPTFEPPTDQAGVFSYYVVISFPGNGGCSDITSNTVDITVYQTPILSDFTTTICSGDTFSIDPDETNGDTVPIGTTYTWSAPIIDPVGAIFGAAGETTPQNNISQTLSNPISGVIATATYTVIPNSEICPGDPFTIVVTVNPQINVEAIVTNSACFEFDNAQIEITITGGVPFTTGDPFIISWLKDGVDYSNDEDIENLEPGTYTLIITDSEGCEFTDTYIITQPEELLLGSLDVFEDITCFGFDDGQIAVTIIGGTLDYIYEWEKDGDGLVYSNDEDLTNLPPGVYVLTVTDENGCVLVLDPLEIIEPELLTITLIEKVDIDCYGFNTGSIDIEANGGRPGYTYSWTGPGGFTSPDPDIFDLFPGTYTLVVTDTSGCTETLTEVIVQNDEITATINVTDVTCYGYNNGIIEIESIVGGVPFTTGEPYDILWSNLGSGLVQENLSPGIYTITITDALGCQRQYEIEVLEAPIFTLDPDVDQISCSGEDDGRIAINIVGGVAPFTVFWLDDPSAGIVRNNLPAGIYNVTVTDSSPIGPCVIEQEFVILPVAPLEISATVTDAFDCDDPNSGSINLSITGGTVSSSSSYSITWSNGATTEDLINIGPGVYFVTVVDDNNCQITGQWEVNRFDPLDVTVTTESVADCDTRELYQVFTASTTGGIPDYTYLWSSGEVSGVNGEIMTATQNGTVTLTVTDSIGCVDNYSFNVDLPEIGEVNFDQTSVGFINFGFYSILEPIQFINLTGGDYQVIIWDFGDGNFSNQENPTHTYTTPGTYTVTLTVTYPFGCTYTYSSDIIIEKGYKLIFPNAFTPNQDNLNDYFRPEYSGLNNLELRIFDTWGSQIYFESGDNISGWNGILKNKLAENGNYYYTFKAKTSYGEIIIQDGSFTLIR